MQNERFVNCGELWRFSIIKEYTRAKVRSYIPAGYEALIDELLNLCDEDGFLLDQYSTILSSVIRLGQAPAVVKAVSEVIKALTCDHLEEDEGGTGIFSPARRTAAMLNRLAKEEGCKFYLASDAHHNEELDLIPLRAPAVIEALGLTEEDQFRI